MKKINIRNLINSFSFLFISIIYPIYIAVMPSYNAGLGNITTNILLMFLLLIIIFNIKQIIKYSKNNIVLFVIQLLLLLISFQVTNTGLGSIGTVVVLSLILLQAAVIKIEKKYILLCIPYYFLIWVYAIFTNYKVLSVNTNNAACISFYMSIILISALSLFIKSKKIKMFIYIFIILTGISRSLYYDARNITIVYLLMGLFIFVFHNKDTIKVSKFKVNLVWFMISLFSLIIVFTYVSLYKNGIKFDFSSLSDKNFYSGREIIWSNLITVFNNDNFIFGIGSNSIWFPTIGAHNYMLSVLVLFGLPHFIFFITLLYTYVKKLLLNKFNIVVCYSIIALFMTEYFEASLIDGRKLSVLFILTCIYFSKDNKKLKENEQNEKNQSITNNIKYGQWRGSKNCNKLF